jgi:hypothetical protein
VEVGSEPLSIQMDGYAMLSWLNLIQQLPPAPAGKGEPAQP